MTYTVHEIFLTQQGEGVNLGRTCVFIRFAGCNLCPAARSIGPPPCAGSAIPSSAAASVSTPPARSLRPPASLWPAGQGGRRTVLTGGEPLLQVDAALLDALRAQGFWIAVETNGTRPLPGPFDWVCVSPKAGAPLALTMADELKLVFPQPGAAPDRFDAFESAHRWLSPMDGPARAGNTAQAAAFCAAHPGWRLNIQAHKTWNIP